MFCFIYLLFCFVHTSHQNECFWTLQKEFGLDHPLIITNKSNGNTKILKQLSKKSQFAKLVREADEISKKGKLNVIYFVNSNYNINKKLNHLLNISHITLILMVQDPHFDELYKNLELEINKKVFLFKESTQELYETYSINNQYVQRKLGHINSQTNSFIWSENVDSNFFKRRSNFHGKVFKGMTDFSGTDMNANPTYVKNAPYFSSNQTFLINGYTYGLFNDILQILEAKLNFSTLLYKRKKTAWGYIYPQPNGSYIGTGMVGDLFFNRAEIIVAPLALFLKRAHYIDYLPPVTKYFAALYTPTLDLVESLDLRLFISPLTINVWMIIGIISILTALIKLVIFSYNGSIHILDFFPALWTSFISFFGGKPTGKSIDSKKTYRIIIFTSLLSGTIVWIMYRSYLTSELSIIQKVYPFTDMNGFSETSWRCTISQSFCMMISLNILILGC